jgi:DNA repair exonuclease SbcCD ATPase subunit
MKTDPKYDEIKKLTDEQRKKVYDFAMQRSREMSGSPRKTKELTSRPVPRPEMPVLKKLNSALVEKVKKMRSRIAELESQLSESNKENERLYERIAELEALLELRDARIKKMRCSWERVSWKDLEPGDFISHEFWCENIDAPVWRQIPADVEESS